MEEKPEYAYIDPINIKYRPRVPQDLDLRLNDVIVWVTENIAKDFSRKAFSIITNNKLQFERFLELIFWDVHLHFFHHEEARQIQKIESDLSRDWGQFLYEQIFEHRIPQDIRDRFLHCIPYFFTQAIQTIYVNITLGNPLTIQKSFRVKIATFLVKLFTGVIPLDSLILNNLGYYFKKPPQADIPDDILRPPTPEKHVILKSEDVSSLIEMDHRKRAKSTVWKLAGISPLISKATKHQILPYLHDASLEVDFPTGGTADWTSDLPPLIPAKIIHADITNVDEYDPTQETRSLLLRSRRPDIIPNCKKMTLEYKQRCKDRELKVAKSKSETRSQLQKVRNVKPPILHAFIHDLKTLQDDKKRGETPQWLDEKKKADVKIEAISAPSPAQQRNENDEIHTWEVPPIPPFHTFYLPDVINLQL